MDCHIRQLVRIDSLLAITSPRQLTCTMNDFDDYHHPDHLIFGPIDLDDQPVLSTPFWQDSFNDVKPAFSYPYEYYDAPQQQQADDLATWIHDPDDPASPIATSDVSAASSYAGASFGPFATHDPAAFSPTSFAALHPLPRSMSPPSAMSPPSISAASSTSTASSSASVPIVGFDNRQRVNSHSMSISPRDMSALQPPAWASQLWDSPESNNLTIDTQLLPQSHQQQRSLLHHQHHHSLSRPSIRHSPMTSLLTSAMSNDSHNGSGISGSATTIRQRRVSAGHIAPALFHSSSAPSGLSIMKGFGGRDLTDKDRDATIRMTRRSMQGSSGSSKRSPESSEDTPMSAISPVGPAPGIGAVKTEGPSKSLLRPPKLAPSAWQLYFTDWIQKQQAAGTRKLNVAQAAKEAGQEYACLSTAEKEPYKRRSQAMKDAREKEHDAYMRTLTPDDIKRENAFRAAQRKAGKSRKSNIKDPNAPKKPLSAYFMFLQRIRSDPSLVKDIFGDEGETTKQSVLAAARWRAMTDAERQPFLAQAEQEKMEYEAARRVYEEGTASGSNGGTSGSFGTSINFSILPGSPHFALSPQSSQGPTMGHQQMQMFPQQHTQQYHTDYSSFAAFSMSPSPNAFAVVKMESSESESERE
ncbi:hypothetical protein D9619_000607 [Psilocybe cf. subviscida]|uniref:HMG box domain-containing protein n=1 Tax=Psilocybe cf. subviscida TaxID=2480587 RepID=A0A8H5BGT7_9AGAR|nr:hypothetical protein D9619_000607 [Psilocybe cf. subviscida]